MTDGPSNPQQEREIILTFKDVVDGLHAEVERLHAEIEARKAAAEKVYLEQVAEIERLHAENEQLKVQLVKIMGVAHER